MRWLGVLVGLIVAVLGIRGVAADTSRLARNVYLAETFKHDCRKRSVKVIFSKLPEVNTMVDLVIKYMNPD